MGAVMADCDLLVSAVQAAPYPDNEIVIIDDCSTDGTRELLAREIAPLVDCVLYHDVNRGKGAALRTGIARRPVIRHHPGCRPRI
jgi:glycosyltransferase involved in cell wall biosynthesis